MLGARQVHAACHLQMRILVSSWPGEWSTCCHGNTGDFGCCIKGDIADSFNLLRPESVKLKFWCRQLRLCIDQGLSLLMQASTGSTFACMMGSSAVSL